MTFILFSIILSMLKINEMKCSYFVKQSTFMVIKIFSISVQIIFYSCTDDDTLLKILILRSFVINSHTLMLFRHSKYCGCG